MEDSELLRQFEDLSLPFSEWTHRAHVRVAYLHLQRDNFDEAMTRLRQGIKAYNAKNNRPDGPLEGYNETTTHGLLHLIAATMQAYRQTHPVKSADEFCDMHPQLMTKHALRLFYSPQRRVHPLAKTQFVEPDLTPLPRRGD
jgi:outer membrane protein assembly factor BamD (BamD/ComL family)